MTQTIATNLEDDVFAVVASLKVASWLPVRANNLAAPKAHPYLFCGDPRDGLTISDDSLVVWHCSVTRALNIFVRYSLCIRIWGVWYAFPCSICCVFL